jgi:hypothetical protein
MKLTCWATASSLAFEVTHNLKGSTNNSKLPTREVGAFLDNLLECKNKLKIIIITKRKQKKTEFLTSGYSQNKKLKTREKEIK